MIIDAKTIIITLVVVVVAFTWGLKFIRQFALQIAQENHAAVSAMDQDEEEQRRKKERSADAAAATAFAKVEPMLSVPKAAAAAKPVLSVPKAAAATAKPEAKSGEIV